MRSHAELSLFPLGGVQPPRAETWWTRNWKWIFALLVLMVMAVFVYFSTVVSWSVIYTIRSSGALGAAVEQAGRIPAATERLGTPITIAGFPSGTVSFEQTEGFADIRVPVEGPKGQAELAAMGEKKNGRWVFTSLTLKTAEGTLDLLHGGYHAD